MKERWPSTERSAQPRGFFDVIPIWASFGSRGPGAVSALNSIVASDLAKIGNGQAQYSMLCNESGGVVDDFIIYRFTEDNVFIIPNATNATKVFHRLSEALPSGIIIENLHNQYGIIAIQGPLAANVLGRMGLPFDCDYMNWLQADMEGERVIVCRTGYTGEAGFELVAPVGRVAAPVGSLDSRCRASGRNSGWPGRARYSQNRNGIPIARPRH